MANLNYLIYGQSVNEFGKQKCGDYQLWSELLDEGLIILALSDGVGSRHHDYIASRTACSSFIKCFSEDKTQDLVTRFEAAVKFADKQVSDPENASHKGMMATFVAIVFNLNFPGTFLYCNIGDSRIYKLGGDGLVQISKDSRKAVVMHERNGKLITQNGVIVIREGLTNALGFNSTALIKIEQSDEFRPGEILFLTSDGMHEIPDFNLSISEALFNPDLSHAMERFMKRSSELFSDDASILVFRRSDQSDNFENVYHEMIINLSDFHEKKVMAHLLAEYIQAAILKLISDRDTAKIKLYVTYCELFKITFTPDFIEETLVMLRQHNFFVSELYHLLINRLKRLKF
jgi:serine/threonine protein phosphatase PrpC